MSASGPHESSPNSPSAHPSWRRRRFVVDARYQLRAGILVGSVAIALLILLNLSLMSQGRLAATMAGGVPATSPATSHRDGTSWVLIVLGSGVFVAGVFAIGIFESHRTAGAAYAIRRAIDQIRDGRTGVRVKLRRGDHLQELAQALNQLSEALDAERSGRS